MAKSNRANGPDGARRQRTFREKVFRVLGFCVGVVSFIAGFQFSRDIAHTRSVGIAAVVDLIESYTRTKRRGHTTVSSTFTFRTARGRVVTRTRSFPEELIRNFEAGVPVTVLYDPANPYEFIFENENASWVPFAFGAGFIAVAVFVL
jgi:hypothetical protein